MSEFTYKLPKNFSKRVSQYLQQKNTALSDAFNKCECEYQDQGLAYYAGLRGDNWNKNAVDITIEGKDEDIELLEFRKKDLEDAIRRSLKSDESGLLLRDLFFFVSDEDNSSIDIIDEIEDKFVEISNRQASFDEMSTDEKLAEIVNLLENLLKSNGKFASLQYTTICFDYVSADTIKKYRKQLHCFRHSSDDAIRERKSFSEEQKHFLIDYGLTIINAVHELAK